jgi:hypothetical protein
MKHKREVITYIENPYNQSKKMPSKGNSLDKQGRIWKNDLFRNDTTSQRPR